MSKPIGGKFSFAARLKSFAYAFQGLSFMLRTQHNAWLHVLAMVVVVVFGFVLHVTASDWRWLIAAIAMVWVTEALNTAIEYVCDVVSPTYSEAVKHAKDIAAGAVLLSAIGAALIGILTFWNYVF